MNVFPRPRPQIEILIHRVDGNIDIEQVFTFDEARAFCRKELTRATTFRVICDDIGFDFYTDWA